MNNRSKRQHLTAPSFALSAPIAPEADDLREGSPLAPAPTEVAPPPPEAPLAVHEVLGFPAWLLSGLPLPATLVCRRILGGEAVVIATAADAPPGPAGAPRFFGRECDALAQSAEQDRGDMAGWCARKAKLASEWRLTSIEALGQVRPEPVAQRWSVGQVLRALGLRLEEILT